ncbi:MAG: DUF3520 domain-containing protein, partial [Robiginitomaculum sp.]|nr:DUF3520 domain-containing protein [Robiginitomaculum sp.]
MITSNKQQPFSTNISLTPSPWNSGTQLLHIGIKGYDIKPDKRPAANLVLLFDVSGSMRGKDRLPLAIKAMKLLVDQMNNKDRVGIVVYAGAAGMVLAPTTGDNKQAIYAALENLKAGGSTAGGEGLRLAYSLAEQNFDKNAVNRVILATDGDFNVGVVSGERLEDFVTRKRDSGIYLSVMGFGRGNYNDQMMQKIAQAGNGNAAYIGTLNEARKVLVEEMQGALFTIAEDVKIQVEFNPAKVAEYRLIGYETRMLKREDFANDKVDAAEIGSGHTVTAIYEITAPDSKARVVEDLRYGVKDKSVVKSSDEIAHVRIRYKLPKQEQSRLIEQAVTDADKIVDLTKALDYVQFSTAVAGFAQILRSETRLPKSGELRREIVERFLDLGFDVVREGFLFADLLQKVGFRTTNVSQQLFLVAGHVFQFDLVEIAAGTGIDHDNLLFHEKRRVLRLFQEFRQTGTTVQQALGRGVE